MTPSYRDEMMFSLLIETHQIFLYQANHTKSLATKKRPSSIEEEQLP